MQWRSALHGGTEGEATIWLASSSCQRWSGAGLINIPDVYDHADAKFMYCGETVRRSVLWASIVARWYVIHYLQTTMFTLFEKNVKDHNFCVDALRYNKTNRDWRLDRYWKFSPLSS